MGGLLVLGGVFAVVNPKSTVLISSGPAYGSEYPKPVLDDISKERSERLGYAAILLGLGICATGIFVKGVKAPPPHDNAA
jgi:hypothetical protein